MINDWGNATTTTTGTGALTLAGVTGWPAPSDMRALNLEARYVIRDGTTFAPLAAGIGYLSGTSTLVRGATEKTWNGTTLADGASPLSLSAGTKIVEFGALSEDVSPAVPAIQGVTGQKLILPDGMYPGGSPITIGANAVFGCALRWHFARPLASLACAIGTSGGTGSDRVQLGVYTIKENGNAGSLVMRSGDILPNSTGYKTSSLAGGNAVLLPGWYYFVVATSVSVGIIGYDGGSNGKVFLGTPMGHTSGSILTPIGYMTGSVTSGWTALPSSLTWTGGSDITTNFPPMVGGIAA